MAYEITKRRETQREYYQMHSEKIKLRKKKWRDANPDYNKQYRIKNAEQEKIRAKNWAAKNPERIKSIGRKSQLKKYGLSIEEYQEMLKIQGGVCAICLKAESVKLRGNVKSLSVDHNHTTGDVRKLLCDNCNKAVGLLQDNPIIAKNMANYLMQWN